MDDTTQRVFKLAQECIEELQNKVEYIELLEAYIEELENGVEVSAPESVQLEQPMEMEESNDDMDDRRPSVVRSRQAAQRDQGTTRSISEGECGSDDGDGGDGSIEASADNLDK